MPGLEKAAAGWPIVGTQFAGCLTVEIPFDDWPVAAILSADWIPLSAFVEDYFASM